MSSLEDLIEEFGTIEVSERKDEKAVAFDQYISAFTKPNKKESKKFHTYMIRMVILDFSII